MRNLIAFLLALVLACNPAPIVPEEPHLLAAGTAVTVINPSGSSTLALPTPLASGSGPTFEVTNSQQGGGLSIFLSAARRSAGAGQAPDNTTRPIWILTIHHESTDSGAPAVPTSQRRVDALGDAMLCIPSQHVTLQPAIEQGASMVASFAALPAAASPLGAVYDFAYSASADLACRGQGFGQQYSYTFLGQTNLASGGTANTGAIAIPPGIKLVALQFDNSAISVRYEHLAQDGTTVVQQNTGQVNNVIGSDVGFARATNLSTTTAVKVRFIGTGGI